MDKSRFLPATSRPRRRSRAEQCARAAWRYGCDGLCAWLGLDALSAALGPWLGHMTGQEAASCAIVCLALISLLWERRETPPGWFVRLMRGW